MKKLLLLTIFASLYFQQASFSQEVEEVNTSNSGWFSLGGRSTVSLFDHDGSGLGTGGQFRIRLSNQVNTDWFFDYITINASEKVRSVYYHIGWSVLFYPSKTQVYPKVVQPYILAGHCFDYNEKIELANSSNTQSRWGSAVQAGIGSHFHLSEKINISLTTQYMIHLTPAIEVHEDLSGNIEFHQHESTIEGHLLSTISLNVKLFQLWKK